MKKGVVGFSVFTLFLLVLLSSGIFAAAPAPGTCAIVYPNECVEASGNYRIMGLSATTNAHAQVPYSDYSYVLCCGFGTGDKTCTTGNTALKLSSSTNAHAEAPNQNNYLTKVCYEDLSCISSTNNCGATGSDVETYKLNFSSLSSTTNAHVGAINDFPVKICCKSAKFLSPCTIKSASWNQAEANEGVNVYLTVKGSGLECDGQTLNIEVIGATQSNATSAPFTGDTALSWWTAEWQSSGFGDKSYYFNASVVGVLSYSGKSMKSSNSLTVKQISPIDHCSTISSCEGYTDSNECNTDTPCAKATEEGISQGVACDGVKTYCSCSWDAAAAGTQADPNCKFRWSEIDPGLCNSSSTKCYNSATGVDFCCPGSDCTLCNGVNPSCNTNSVCETGEGCTCADCNGKQDSCVSGATCSGGQCSGTTVPTNTEIRCKYGFTLCTVSGKNYCYPGNTCPSGQIPPSNANGKCDVGEGCLSTDCKDGNQDSCVSRTYCSLGKCASIQDPIAAGSVGGCKITQTIEKNCDVEPVGYKIISWTGTWTGTIDTSNPSYQRCIAGGRATIPCPAQIQLPFFDYYELGITLGVIALIYVSLIFRRKLKRKKK